MIADLNSHSLTDPSDVIYTSPILEFTPSLKCFSNLGPCNSIWPCTFASWCEGISVKQQCVLSWIQNFKNGMPYGFSAAEYFRSKEIDMRIFWNQSIIHWWSYNIFNISKMIKENSNLQLWESHSNNFIYLWDLNINFLKKIFI